MGPLERRVASAEAALLPASASAAGNSGGAREELLRRLDALAARQWEAPDWREPTPEEGAAIAAEVRTYFAERFGEEVADAFAPVGPLSRPK